MFGDLVSIITPTYNCVRFIEETIRSVQAQTYQNWEMIISDDCSTDNTREVIAPYLASDSRIKYICNERNSGAAITRNNALKVAEGRWIAFLDSDDLWLPLKLEHQIRFMEENKYHFSYTNYCEIDEQSNLLGVEITGPRHINKYCMYAYCWPGCLTVMYDTKVVGLVQIADIKKNNDYAMWLKVIHKAKCYLLPESLAKYRRGRTGSISTQSCLNLVKWHYKLFHEAVGAGWLVSSILTLGNLVFGLIKKTMYVKKIA